jgi:hypothetical protein
MSILRRFLGSAFFLLALASTAIGTAALKIRQADGPLRLFAGGELRSGPLMVAPEPDWAFTEEIDTIEFQLVEPPTSRRVWISHYDGKIYLITGGMDTLSGRLWFSWPHDAERDGRAVIRVDGVRYPRMLRRIRSGAEIDGVVDALREKYEDTTSREDIESGVAWLFEMAPGPGVDP